MMKQTLRFTALLSALALTACQPENSTKPAASDAQPVASSAVSASSVDPEAAAASGTHAPVPAAGNNNEDPAFKADALVLLKVIEEIGVQSSTYLDSDEMRQKVAEFGKSKDEAQKNKLAVEIYQSNINLYRDAVEKLKTLQVKNQDVVGLRDLWIKKFETDIELFNIQIKEQGKGLTDAQIQEKYKDIYRQNRDLAQDAAEQNMALYKRSR